MSFSARIEADLIAVEAGATVPIGIEVENRSESPDRFEIQIEGLDPEWTAVPVPVFPVGPGDKQTEKLFFKPPRASESLAGNYPFVVRLRSLETGEARTVQGVLQIKPFHHLSMELNPKRGSVSFWRSQNSFHVTLMNLGNTEHTLQLYGNDPDEALAFEFEQEQVTVAPGQQKTVEVYADPTTRRFFSSTRLYMFSISARSIEQPSILTSSQAQLEQRPLLSPASLIVLALLLGVLAFWVAMLPKPPTIDSFTVSPNPALVGQDIALAWETSGASKVYLTIGGGTQELNGDDRTVYRFIEPGTYKITLDAINENGLRRSRSSAVTVIVPAKAPPPEIRQFTIVPRNPKLGETFVVNYAVASATKIRLEPTGIDLDVNGNQQELKAERVGSITYTLKAFNRDGSEVRKQATITVVDPTMPSVVSFELSPKELDELGGEVKIAWNLVNTVRQEMVIGEETVRDLQAAGELTRTISATTTVTIRGWDGKGREVTKKATITVKKPEPPPDTTTGGDQPPTTGGTTTTGGDGG